MNMIVCPQCGDLYPDFDVAHVCSRGPRAPKFDPVPTTENDTIQNLLGQALDQAVPYTWTRLDRQEAERVVRCFAELLIKECADVAANKDSSIIYTADMAGKVAAGRLEAARLIREHFGVST